MEKSEFRVLIKHYFLCGKTIKQTEEKLKKYYGDSAPSHGMVHKWFAEFRWGRTSTNDAERSGRPNEVTTEEMVNKIHDIVLKDRQLKIREIAKMVNISNERVFNILHEHLSMRNLSARWVPRTNEDTSENEVGSGNMNTTHDGLSHITSTSIDEEEDCLLIPIKNPSTKELAKPSSSAKHKLNSSAKKSGNLIKKKRHR